MTPQVVIPVGSPDAQTSVGTAIQANVVRQLRPADGRGRQRDQRHGLGAAGVCPSRRPLAPRRHRNERAARRGRAAHRDGARVRVVTRPRGRAGTGAAAAGPHSCGAHELVAPRGRPGCRRHETRLAPRRLRRPPDRALAALRQRETTASRESEITSLEWRQRGLGRMAVRYVQQRASDSALDAVDEASSRVEVDLPTLAPHSAGRLDLRAGLTAGSSSLTGPGVNSRVSGRVGLIDDAALTGETELGITGGGGQVLRALRVTRDMPVVPAMRLQLSYSYRARRWPPSARCSKRASCGGSTWAGSPARQSPHHLLRRLIQSPIEAAARVQGRPRPSRHW